MTAGRQVISQKKDWGTPLKYVNAVKEVFNGVIHLDPCSSPFSLVGANVEYMLPEKDGLSLSWNFPTIYVNPPYGKDIKRNTRILHWISKCEESHRLYKAEVLALVPVATNTAHWKKYIYGKATGICFLYDTRLRFLVDGKDEGKGAPMSCAMVYWGNNFDRFFEVFIHYGAVVNITNLQGLTMGKKQPNGSAKTHQTQTILSSIVTDLEFPVADQARLFEINE